MTFNPSDDYDDDRVCLTVTGEFQGRSVEAYCSPDSNGDTFLDDGTQLNESSVTDQHGAPFKVDIVLLDGIVPNEGEMEPIRDEVGSAVSAQFEEKTDNIFNKLQDSEDPIEEIMSTSAEDL